MQKVKHEPKSAVLHPSRLWAIRIFIAVAFVIGSYLLTVSLRGMNVVGCGPDSGCEKVLQSRWAYWFGLPVSAFALAVYGAIFAATFRLGSKDTPPMQRKVWTLLVPAGVVVIGAALWFIILQLFVIKAICPFCMTAHGSGMIAAVIILLSAPFAPAPEKSRQREKEIFIPPSLTLKLVIVALAGVGVLVGGQIVHQKKTFAVATIPGVSPALPGSNSIPGSTVQGLSNSAAAGKLSTNAPAKIEPVPPNPYAGKFFVVYQTNVLDLRQVPIIGSSNAPFVMVSLYDYTCHHCRLTHGPLMDAYRAFSNDLAIVSLPMPLDPACNPSVRVALGPHTNACQYARIGLTVWRADRTKMPQFDEFMFASENPPSVEAALQFGVGLVGVEAFRRAQQDPWGEQQLQQDIRIYDIANRMGHGNMPQIILGRQVVLGHIDREHLFKMVAREFGLQQPSS